MQTPIIPVTYGPLGLANTLSIRGVGPVDDSGCPDYFYSIARVTETSPAVPEVPAVPATEDTAEIPAVAAVAATYETVTLVSGNKAMTQPQWDNWGKTPTDEEYQLTCLATNLGLTRA